MKEKAKWLRLLIKRAHAAATVLPPRLIPPPLLCISHQSPNSTLMGPTADSPADPATDSAAEIAALMAYKSNLASLLHSASAADLSLKTADRRLSLRLRSLSAASDSVTALQSQSIAVKSLHTRINRAVSPALSLLHTLSLAESLDRRLLRLPDPSGPTAPPRLLKYVDRVDRLSSAVGSVTAGWEPAVQRLQEAVEFLSRTKATDQLRIRRLRETLDALKALYEGDVEAMRYEGGLDEALLRLQEEYETILRRIKHDESILKNGEGANVNDEDEDDERPDGPPPLGSDVEVEVLRRISETLAANDCLDICIDIYVKVRYRRTAKTLMRLNPDYLKTYAPEEIDKMDWESLESAIALWIQHFELAVRTVFVAEKRLCSRVLSGVMDGAVWPECFAKIADKIMAVFFRFGEGVARSAKEPQKLFKLLDMFDAMDRIRPGFSEVFGGEPGADISARFRELQKLLVHAASKVFWEFGLQIEGLQDAAPPPADGSVPKVVRYAVNYLKYLAGAEYGAVMGRVLKTEQTWKSGFLSTRAEAEVEEELLKEAVGNALDALRRNVEAKRGRYKDRVAPHVLAMNSYWYMYMRTRGSELARLVGEETMRKRYKAAAEEAAYSYQAAAWGPLVRLLDGEKGAVSGEEEGRGRVEGFMREFEQNLRRHRSAYCIPDADLKEQIREAVAELVVSAYAGFLHRCSGVVQGRSSFLPPDSIREMLGRLFDGGGEGGRRAAVAPAAEGGRSSSSRRREFRSRGEGRGAGIE